MESFTERFELMHYIFGGYGETTVIPAAGNGTVFFRYEDTGELFAFEGDFDGLYEHAQNCSGTDLWPDMDPATADLSLFSVHIMETIDLAPPKACRILWKEGGLQAVPGSLPPAVVAFPDTLRISFPKMHRAPSIER
ncbi:hypothetical protein [Glutamicibacter sp. PS]|uniref:hypothetical protein n=1 Tax=Glutamicibacter sp. PS TaxID=3075634 RepID=UPI00284C7757|nr:hypothetical protein [Glutamicibacter sp. PS]MDR4532840.1 hypothetical protein [Glutamicibacter sp. PS]